MDLQHSPATRSRLLGRHTPATSTGKSAVSMHAPWCCPASTFTRSSAPCLYPGCRLAMHRDCARRFSGTIVPVRPHSWRQARDHLWWLGKIPAHTTTASHYIVRIFDDSGPVKLKLSSTRYTMAIGAERDSWCLHTLHGRTV